MRASLVLAAVLFLTSCSDPAPVAKKEPEKPLAPLTGRQAFQQTYPAARAWAIDSMPLRIRSIPLSKVPADKGTSGAWEIAYVSLSKARLKTYTWSAIEAEGGLHKGVFPGLDEGWRQGSEIPFRADAIKIDTPDALETALKHSETYFKNPAPKPPVHFNLECSSRYPDPVWRVYWGESLSAAEWSVFIDATTGEYKGR